jgi:hypothetical protein
MDLQKIRPESLDLVMRDSDFIIYSDDQPLKTRQGNEFASPNGRLLRHILTDLQLFGIPGNSAISSCRLFEFQCDCQESGGDRILRNIDRLAENDHFILLKSGRRKSGRSFAEPEVSGLQGGNEALMNTVFWGISSVIMNLNAFIAENIRTIETDEAPGDLLLLLLKQEYLNLSADKKAAFHFLSFMHKAGLCLPLLLVNEHITPAEYAKGLISLQLTEPEAFFSQYPEDPDLPTVMKPLTEGNPGIPELVGNYLRDAMVVRDYTGYFASGQGKAEQIRDIIRTGESYSLEFKSTLRWDLKQGKTNPAIERACLKTISAFLNSDGGNLLIGIRDDGSVEGIESDRFANEDKFLLHLWTLIRTCLGRDVSPHVQTTLEKMDDKNVCLVRVTRSMRPVFLRQPGFNEEFFIRLGPSSNALDISEALKYIADHFKER